MLALSFTMLALINPMDRIYTESANLANEYGIEQELILAIIETESTFNPLAKGGAGEVGLMQLHPRYHKNISYVIEANMQQGVAYLAKLKTQCYPRLKDAWFLCYNLGKRKALALDKPREFAYYKKVRKHYAKAEKSLQSRLLLASSQD